MSYGNEESNLLFEDWDLPDETPPTPKLEIVPARPLEGESAMGRGIARQEEAGFETLDLGRGMVSPRLNRQTGEMRFPLNVSPRFRHWKDSGQSLFRTLVEFDAPLKSWRRYGLECPEMLRAGHLSKCAANLRWYPSVDEDNPAFLCCPECGWWYQCNEEDYHALGELDVDRR